MPADGPPVKTRGENPLPPKPKHPSDTLSELEGAVLGLLVRTGPMTAHAVRRVFADSPIDHFSGSAGSIYPLMKRLDRDGLVEPAAQGAKGGTAYSLTAAGRQALRGWVTSGDLAAVAGVTFDPLRTRVLALGALTPKQRERFLERAELELTDLVSRETTRLREHCDDEWSRAAMEGSVAVLRARLRWIRALREHADTAAPG